MKTILDFAKAKMKNEKITMLTCYDYTFAQILNETNVDTLLVGDSVAQVMYGHKTTLHATLDMLCLHTEAVHRGAPNKFIVADMPFLTTRKGTRFAVGAAGDLLKAGAQAVKIEGADGHTSLIQHLVESGIPVIGHLGLTPQSIHQLGGPKIQGRNDDGAAKILHDAAVLEKVGCFSLVLECIPAKLSEKITTALKIPTIGIGAGEKVSGQVLVLQDMLGLNPNFSPTFLKKYLQGHALVTESINQYVEEVKKSIFPKKEHSYE